MLTPEDIQAIAQKAGLDIWFDWQTPTETRDATPPVPQLAGIRLKFKQPAPEAWVALMSSPSVVPVSLAGTRQVSGSGAIDGTLHVPYALLLEVVNVNRRKAGLAPVRN